MLHHHNHKLRSLPVEELNKLKTKQADLIRQRAEVQAEKNYLKEKMEKEIKQLDESLYNIDEKCRAITKITIFEVKLDNLPSTIKCNEGDKKIINEITTVLNQFKSKFGVEYVTGAYDTLKNEVHMKFSRAARANGVIEGIAAMKYLQGFPHREGREAGWASHLDSTVLIFSTNKLNPMIEGLNKFDDLNEKEQKKHRDAVSLAMC